MPAARDARAVAPGARRHPRRRSLAPDQESVLELQRLAGNGAVSAALARARAGGRVATADAIKVDRNPMAPESGLAEIRKKANGRGVMGYTIRAIEDSPPLLRPETPIRGHDGSWTTRARPIGHLPEPILDAYWPLKNRHKVADRTYIEIDQDWATKLEQGENEHVDDATLAWQLTWKKAADLINGLARKPGPAAATPEAATRALWRRYRDLLPEDMRPEGETPTDSAQRDVLAVRGGTFFGWMWEITIVRDTRGYHEPRTKPVPEIRNASVSRLEPADSKIPGPEPDALIKEVREKYRRGERIKGSKLP